MVAGPIEAVKYIDRYINVDSPPRSTREILKNIILGNKWAEKEQAEELSEEWLPRFTNKLHLIISESINRGQYRSFTFTEVTDSYLQGYCFHEPSDSEDIRNSKTRRSNTLNIFQYIRGLNPDKFETLSVRILHLLGVELAYATPRSSDHGIDFFGRIMFGDMIKPSLLNPGAEKHFSIWIVGQSKHYKDSRVSTPEIRELIGSIELAKAKIFAGKVNPLKDLEIKICDPIFYLFFTSGQFSRDSIDLMSRGGVLSFDGLQIAQFLADHNTGLVNGLFDQIRFNNWLLNGL